jgi:hypothetical protein
MSTQTPATFDPVEIPSKYAKAIVAIIFAVLTVFVTALTDNRLDGLDLTNIVIAFLTAVLVYAVPNIKDQTVGTYAKVIIAFLGSAAQALVPFIANGDVTSQQWLLVLLAAIGALGVGIVPNVNPEKVALQAASVPSNVVVVGDSTTPAVTIVNTGAPAASTEPERGTNPDA